VAHLSILASIVQSTVQSIVQSPGFTIIHIGWGLLVSAHVTKILDHTCWRIAKSLRTHALASSEGIPMYIHYGHVGAIPIQFTYQLADTNIAFIASIGKYTVS